MYSANTTIKYKRIITDFGLLINQILIWRRSNLENIGAIVVWLDFYAMGRINVFCLNFIKRQDNGQ